MRKLAGATTPCQSKATVTRFRRSPPAAKKLATARMSTSARSAIGSRSDNRGDGQPALSLRADMSARSIWARQSACATGSCWLAAISSATAVADEIAANQHDPVAQALWRAHIERALMSARKLKAGWPSPRLSLRDPMALRALVLILAVASFFAAGGERLKRVTVAFDWQGVVAPANFRIDAWVTPPVYTGRPPVMLPGLRPGETAQPAATIAVPSGSQLVIRSTGNVHFDVVRNGG